MSKGRNPGENFDDYRTRVIDPISDSFCGAKWYNATIWLGHGGTASCHHPPAHNIDKEEIKTNPSAIHNTRHKKKMRQMMLEGTRPKECEYCWKIEDMEKDADGNSLEGITYLITKKNRHGEIGTDLLYMNKKTSSFQMYDLIGQQSIAVENYNMQLVEMQDMNYIPKDFDGDFCPF